MDAFSAANSFAPTSSVVSQFIATRQHEFKQHVSDDTWRLFESQQEIMEIQNPSMTLQQMERLRLNQRNVLDPTSIELMPTPYLLQTSNEFNQPLIMAHPQLAKMHRLGQLEGYGLAPDETRAGLLQRRIMSGMIVDGEHRQYADGVEDLEMYNALTAIERRVTQQNQRNALSTVLDDIDFSSMTNGGF